MTEKTNEAKSDLLGLLLLSLTAQEQCATFAHGELNLCDNHQNHESCTSPAELFRQASELAVSARETAANTASAHSVRGRQLDYVHAQAGALVQMTERYITQARQRRDILQQTQHSAAMGYVDAEAGLRADGAANQLAACLVALESFILAVRALAHQSIAVVAISMGTPR
jgi:hypothetical protein